MEDRYGQVSKLCLLVGETLHGFTVLGRKALLPFAAVLIICKALSYSISVLGAV